MSGLSRTPGKRVRGKTLRGFESRPLRQHINTVDHSAHGVEIAPGADKTPRPGKKPHTAKHASDEPKAPDEAAPAEPGTA